MLSGSRLFVYAYDQVGNVTSVNDTVGGLGTTTNEYDKVDRLTKKVTLAGPVYYQYDLSGRKTSLKTVDPSGTSTENVYTYDAAGRLTLLNLAAGRTSYYHYDGAGLPTRRLMPTNVLQVYYAYDVAGRLSQQVDRNQPAGVAVRSADYTRNANGVISKVDRSGSVFSYYAYDALDRLTQELDLSGAGTSRDDDYSYDAAGNRLTKSARAGSTSETYYAYDVRNLVTREHVLSGSTNYYDYDSAQRMTRQRAAAQAYYFAHDQRDQIKQVHDEALAGASDIQYFAYNGLGERVALRREGPVTTTASYFSYDGSKLVRDLRNDAVVLGRYRQNEGRLDAMGAIAEIFTNDMETGDGKAIPTFDERGSVVQIGADEPLAYYSYDRFGNMAQTGSGTRQRARFVSPAFVNLDRFSQVMYLTRAGLYLPHVQGMTAATPSRLLLNGLGRGRSLSFFVVWPLGRLFFSPRQDDGQPQPPPPPPQDGTAPVQSPTPTSPPANVLQIAEPDEMFLPAGSAPQVEGRCRPRSLTVYDRGNWIASFDTPQRNRGGGSGLGFVAIQGGRLAGTWTIYNYRFVVFAEVTGDPLDCEYLQSIGVDVHKIDRDGNRLPATGQTTRLSTAYAEDNDTEQNRRNNDPAANDPFTRWLAPPRGGRTWADGPGTNVEPGHENAAPFLIKFAVDYDIKVKIKPKDGSAACEFRWQSHLQSRRATAAENDALDQGGAPVNVLDAQASRSGVPNQVPTKEC